MLTERVKSDLQGLVGEEILWDCRLGHYTSYGIGGPADALITLCRDEELIRVLEYAEDKKLPWRVIGRGTNLLVSDKGFRGLVFVLSGDFKKYSLFPAKKEATQTVVAGGGCGLTHLARDCAAAGFSGLEFSCGIPGTLGGAVLMNAGAWGEEIGQRVKSVEVTTNRGQKVLSRKELKFDYRSFP